MNAQEVIKMQNVNGMRLWDYHSHDISLFQ